VLSEQWMQAAAGHRPSGDCPLIHSIIAGLGDLSASASPSRLVVVTAGGDDCGGTRDEVAQALADGQLVVDIRVVGILMPPESAALFEAIPLRNVANPDDLDAILRWALFEGLRTEEPEAPAPPTTTVKFPPSVLAGDVVEVRWTGPDAAEDFISLALPENPGDAYEVWERTDSGNPVVLTAPLQPGAYEIRYVSGTGAKMLAQAPIEVTATAIELQAPATVVADQRFEIRWTGSSVPGDFIAISRPNAPPQRMSDWASTATGSPVTLAAPTRPGAYEVRFVRKSGLEILALTSIEVIH
jgi:hypothetical protein